MKKLLASTALALLTGAALAATPTPASVEALIAASRADQVLDVVYTGLEQNIRQGMTAAVANKPLSPQQQQVLEAMPARLSEVIRTEMSWAALKPIFVQVYSETFDQEEVDGLIAFYQSPLGQRFIAKQGPLAQRSGAATQQLLFTAMPRIQAAMEGAMKEAGLR
jgi:uncharacterized protein